MLHPSMHPSPLLQGLEHEGQWPGALIDGQPRYAGVGTSLVLQSPIDGAPLGQLIPASSSLLGLALDGARAAFLLWQQVPAPRRGELVRRIGQRVREHKTEVAMLVTLETGKITSEAEGEVQEWVDICDYAQGLSRQLAGQSLPSERPSHRLLEQWHPLGPVGVLTAFNFPLAVWAWSHAALGLWRQRGSDKKARIRGLF